LDQQLPNLQGQLSHLNKLRATLEEELANELKSAKAATQQLPPFFALPALKEAILKSHQEHQLFLHSQIHPGSNILTAPPPLVFYSDPTVTQIYIRDHYKVMFDQLQLNTPLAPLQTQKFVVTGTPGGQEFV